MKIVAVVIALVVAATAATYFRYGSLDPCSWMEQDMAGSSGSPRLAVRAAIRAKFLLGGIAAPTPYDCLLGWWEFRTEDLSAGS